MRWVCPRCGRAKLLGPRPRRDAVGRYCLPCSERTGRLVERTCPKLEAEREARSARRAAREARTAEREASRYVVDGFDYREELLRLWKLAQKIEPRLKGRKVPLLRIERRQYGCWGLAYRDGRITLRIFSSRTVGETRRTLVHEVAHFVGWARRAKGHDDLFQVAFNELWREARVGLV